MIRFGDDEAGFSVGYDAESAVVRVRAWGFWSAELAALFGDTVRDACFNRPRGASLAIDMTELKPMREEGQQSFARLMGVLIQLNLTGTIEFSSHLTKLQLLRIVTEAGAKESIRFTHVESKRF